MFKKMCVNVVSVFCCVMSLSVFGFLGKSGVFAQSGVDAYTKLMLHADGSDQGTSFTDSSSGAKTVSFVGWVEQGETQRQPFVVFKKCWVSLHSTQPTWLSWLKPDSDNILTPALRLGFVGAIPRL